MYRYVLDFTREQQNARNKAFEYIYDQLSGVSGSDISLVVQSNGATTSVFYKGHLIGTVHEYYNGSTWNIESKRVPFDEPEEEDLR